MVYQGDRPLTASLPMDATFGFDQQFKFEDDNSGTNTSQIGGGMFMVAPDHITPLAQILHAYGAKYWHQYAFTLEKHGTQTKYWLNTNNSCLVTDDLFTMTAAWVAMVK